MRRKFDPGEIKTAIAISLYRELVKDGRRAMLFRELGRLFKPGIPKNVLGLMVESLVDPNSDTLMPLKIWYPPDAVPEIDDPYYEMTEEAFGYIDHLDDNFYDEIVEKYLLSDPTDVVDVSVPASDRVVTKSDNQEGWHEAANALDEAIEAIENDQSQHNELGPEKGALLKALRAGRELFEDTKIKVDIAIAMTLEPLKIAAKRYEQAAAGAVIATALAIISRFLGLL